MTQRKMLCEKAQNMCRWKLEQQGRTLKSSGIYKELTNLFRILFMDKQHTVSMFEGVIVCFDSWPRPTQWTDPLERLYVLQRNFLMGHSICCHLSERAWGIYHCMSMCAWTDLVSFSSSSLVNVSALSVAVFINATLALLEELTAAKRQITI